MLAELEETIRNQAAEIARLSEAVQSLRLQVEETKRSATASDALTGDCNLAPDSGFIEVDRNVPSHPVVRFRSDRLPSGGGGYYPQPFDLEEKDDGLYVVRCKIFAPEESVETIDFQVSNGEANIYLIVTRSSISSGAYYSISLSQSYQTPSATTACYLLWRYDSDLGYVDERPKVLPLYAL